MTDTHVPSITAMDENIFSSPSKSLEHVIQAVTSTTTLQPCGELACQKNSFQKELDSTVLLAYAAATNDTSSSSKGKKKKKKKSSTDNNGESKPVVINGIPKELNNSFLYHIILSDSIFFPEGGGQPCDGGIIAFQKDNDGDDKTTLLELVVSSAQNMNNICVLTCLGPKGQQPSDILPILDQYYQVSSCEQPSDTSPQKLAMYQKIDWNKRLDHMTAHSAQHLLSAVACSLVPNKPINTASWSFGEVGGLSSYIDFDISSTDMTTIEEFQSQISLVEDTANQHIQDNLPMTPRWMDPKSDEFKTTVRSRLLPEGLTGNIRIVDIGIGESKVDVNTCCGTHVQNLGTLQMIKLTKVEKVKPTIMRTHYSAGKRIMKLLGDCLERQGQFTNMLSCTEKDHVDRVEQLLQERRMKDKEIDVLNEQLCDIRVTDIVQECHDKDNLVITDLGSCDMNFMTKVSMKVLEKLSDTSKPLLLFIATSDQDNDEGNFLICGDEKLVESTGKNIASVFCGRGGGRGGKFQGKGKKIRSGIKEAEKIMIEVKKN